MISNLSINAGSEMPGKVLQPKIIFPFHTRVVDGWFFCSTLIASFVHIFFNRAEDLATAMEARGYQGGEGRTKYRILHWHQRDTMVLVVFVLMTIALVFLRS